MTELSNIPCWYAIVSLLLTVFQVTRGVIGNRRLIQKDPLLSWSQKAFIYYIHGILLHCVCTAFGCACLLVTYRLGSTGLSQLSPTTGALFISSSLIGVAGITGELANILLRGDFKFR